MKTCNRCKQTKKDSEFPRRKNTKSGLIPYCRLCKREYDREYYKNTQRKRTANKKLTQTAIRNRNRKLVVAYLKSHHCVDCGETDIVVLEFDHRDPRTKTAEVSRLLAYSLTRLQEEINKCDIRCANCHRKLTASKYPNYRWAAARIV